jgi:hypothetical protein
MHHHFLLGIPACPASLRACLCCPGDLNFNLQLTTLLHAALSQPQQVPHSLAVICGALQASNTEKHVSMPTIYLLPRGSFRANILSP